MRRRRRRCNNCIVDDDRITTTETIYSDDSEGFPSQPERRRIRGRRRPRVESRHNNNKNNATNSSSLLKLAYYYYYCSVLLLSCSPGSSPFPAAAADSSSPQNDPTSGYMDVQPFCRKKVVTVSLMYLTCDSPGAYYYGSSTYRNSAVCIANDQANIKMKLSISEKMDMNETVYIQIESGVYDRFATVLEPTKLCQLDIAPYETNNNNLEYDENSNYAASSSSSMASRACPNPGTYFFKTYYVVPELLQRNADYESIHYTPDVKVTFTDSTGNRLGCATAGAVAVHYRGEAQGQKGFLALAISLGIFLIVFSALLVLSKWRQKRLEKMAERKTLRYQYFRTLPNGQVVPLPATSTTTGTGAAVQPSSSSSQQYLQQQHHHNYHQQQLQQQYQQQEQQQHYPHGHNNNGTMPPSFPGGEDAFNLTNPSYNETQLPTRPVI